MEDALVEHLMDPGCDFVGVSFVDQNQLTGSRIDAHPRQEALTKQKHAKTTIMFFKTKSQSQSNWQQRP